MAEYINREDLINWLTRPTCFRANCEDCVEIDCLDCIVEEAIKRVPRAEVVEVVHCKDCERRNKSADLSNTVLCSWLHNLEMPKDGFCNYGIGNEVDINGF